jgi:hypothetical protein
VGKIKPPHNGDYSVSEINAQEWAIVAILPV